MSTLAPPRRATVPAGSGDPTEPSPRSPRGLRLSWLRRWPSPVILIALWQAGSMLALNTPSSAISALKT